MTHHLVSFSAATLLFFAAHLASAIDDTRIVDLTHPFDENTISWPTAQSYELEIVASGITKAGHWYSANNFSMAEHSGTHMDAPIHFAEGRRDAAGVPIHQLIGPATVINVSVNASQDPDYQVTVEDIHSWESLYGRIPRGALVLMYSGWAKYWGNKQKYLGSDNPSDITSLHFPSFSSEAASFLISERQVDALGVDTASIDHGQSTDFAVHQIVHGANKPGFENIANLDQLPAVGTTVIALPMKIAGGSGAPVRIIALLP